jgi:succinate dehydrogenase/fumarate reductase-like Fe-S protein
MKQALLRVRRGAGGDTPRYDTYPVPYEEGMSVLDALIWIRRNRDSSLAMRYSCINANACKECTALVDGEVAYLCLARLREGEMTVEPLRTRAVIRDLVTDIVPPREQLRANARKK